MKDLVEKLDRQRELIQARHDASGQRLRDAGCAELVIEAELLGEYVANSRRIATALESLVENTKPVEFTPLTATAELRSADPQPVELKLPDSFTSDLENAMFMARLAFARGQRAG